MVFPNKISAILSEIYIIFYWFSLINEEMLEFDGIHGIHGFHGFHGIQEIHGIWGAVSGVPFLGCRIPSKFKKRGPVQNPPFPSIRSAVCERRATALHVVDFQHFIISIPPPHDFQHLIISTPPQKIGQHSRGITSKTEAPLFFLALFFRVPS